MTGICFKFRTVIAGYEIDIALFLLWVHAYLSQYEENENRKLKP